MSASSLRTLGWPASIWRGATLLLLAVLWYSSAAAAPGDDELPSAQVPQAESARRAEIRRTMDHPDEGARPIAPLKRRSMTPEERRRLRDDIRANRDIYELRERANRKRH